jgi:succinate dehydrogenase/fumarate reductase iron-sulfur protein
MPSFGTSLSYPPQVTEAVGTMAGAVRVRIARSDPETRSVFEVSREEAFVVLDLVAHAAREDPSLAYRYSCRAGFCGTCTILLDGRPVLACQTPVPSSRSVDLAPLGGLPVIRDLVVDPTPFSARWNAAGPARTPTDAPIDGALPRPLDPALGIAGSVASDSLDCISCGACFAACDMAASDAAFLGPAALTRSMVVIADPREARRSARLSAVAGPNGIEGCHGIGACSLACPRDLDPQRAIRRLRRWQLTSPP